MGLSDCYTCLSIAKRFHMIAERDREVENLRARLEQVLETVELSARHSGRSLDEIALVAVSKTHPPDVVREAIPTGVADLAQHRVPETEAPLPNVGADAGA